MSENVITAFAAIRQAQIGGMLRQFGFNPQTIEKAEDADLNENEQVDETEESTEKGEQTNALNPFDVYDAEKAEETDMEKSDIMEAIAYGGNIRVKKTGKEIKEQLTKVVIPAKTAALETKKSEANCWLKDCGDAPTQEPESWRCRQYHIEVPFKFYRWDEMRTKSCDDRVVDSLSYEHQGDQNVCNCPKTKDEANARENYMEAVRAVCEILVDIKACNLLVKNLKDNESIELTPSQVVAFQFD